jgi:cyclopropane-fatty-acyl-phospholipid synthase
VRAFDAGLRAVVRRVFGEAPLRFALPDGTVLHAPPAPPVATVVVKDRATLWRLLRDPEAHFGEAYGAGAVDVRGDLVAALDVAYRALTGREPSKRRFRSGGGHSLRASRQNARQHYDLGNDFYRLWLDDQMVYTCAYFPTPDTPLAEAQVAKMDHVCRKLRLRPGERVVEAGCGWGALALHMARRYGVTVRAYNVSAEQIRFASERAVREQLADTVEFVEDDYRGIGGAFDAFVSIGMLEHVGPENYPALGAVIDRCLDRTGGRGLLHFIGRDRARPLNSWIRKHIFPGAYPPTLGQVLHGALEPAGFSVLDVENLRLHYAKTLSHWLARFESARDAVAARFGEVFARDWRLYLAGSQAAFETGSLQLFQIAFSRSGSNHVPWTRAGLYEPRW